MVVGGAGGGWPAAAETTQRGWKVFAVVGRREERAGREGGRA